MPPTPSPMPILIEMVGGETTFWDSPFLVGMLPLLGVIAGGLLGYFLNRAQENRKARRDQATRWDERLLDLTSSVMGKLEVFIEVAHHTQRERESRTALAAVGVIEDDVTASKLRDLYGVATTYEAHQTLAKALSSLELIAPEAVRQIAEAMHPIMRLVLVQNGVQEVLDKTSSLEDQGDSLQDAIRTHFGLARTERTSGSSRLRL